MTQSVAAANKGPLAGLRVIEFSHMAMGPTCGLALADLGADVVKVEPTPAGDNTRRLTGAALGFFPTFNRNKRSLCVDLKHSAGAALVKKLIAGADVVIENFRPGAMDELGFGHEAMCAAQPAADLLLMQRLPAGPLRASHGARRSRADDGRASPI